MNTHNPTFALELVLPERGSDSFPVQGELCPTREGFNLYGAKYIWAQD